MLIDQSGRWQNTARNLYLFTPTKKDINQTTKQEKKRGTRQKKNFKENTKIFSEKG